MRRENIPMGDESKAEMNSEILIRAARGEDVDQLMGVYHASVRGLARNMTPTKLRRSQCRVSQMAGIFFGTFPVPRCPRVLSVFGFWE